jgi:predicted outer membrane repeat protein
VEVIQRLVTVSSNTTELEIGGGGKGGGVYGGSSLVNCIFIGNSATSSDLSYNFAKGGGVYGGGKVTNCTFIGNTSDSEGGGLYGSPTVTNCIFWNNSDIGGMDESAQIHGAAIVTYSCIMSWVSGGTGNIDTDPNFVFIDDYHLKRGSPCIDSGTNDPPGGLVENDLDGNPRSLDGDGDTIPIADMGVYEHNAQIPSIAVTPNPMEFYAGKDGPNPESKFLSILNCGGGVLDWIITYDCDWLDVSPTSGTSIDEVNEVTLDIDVTGLEVGDYRSELTISDPYAANNPKKVEVILHVVYPVISVTPEELEFQAEVDSSNPPTQIISITNEVAGRLNWTITEDCPWLDVDPNTGESTGELDEVMVSVDITGLPWGDYDCNLTISDPQATNNPQSVTVRLVLVGSISVPSEFSTIQGAINAARGGDKIIVSPGLYWERINFKDKAITLTSLDPDNPSVVNSTIIDVEEYGRAVTVGSKGIIKGFTITGGWAAGSYGSGGLSCTGNSIVSNCVIRNNNGGLVLNNLDGGGVTCSGNAIIKDCIIRNNRAGFNQEGGGILCASGSPQINNCLITNNTAEGKGGGIYCVYSGASPVFNNCIIEDNSARYGGGVYCDHTENKGPTFNNCIFTGNTATLESAGSAIHCYLQSKLTANNCTITGNFGGVYSEFSSSITMNNCIVWENHVPEISGGVVATHSNIQGGYIGEGNIDNDPCFADAANGDLHLQSQAGRWDPSMNSWITDANTSLCIDAGDPNSDWTAELWPHGKHINMGAYGGTPEASMSLSTVGNKADLNNDGFVNAEDLDLFVEMWLVDDLLLAENINRKDLVNFSDWAEFAGQWLWEE